jgi:hypothetical protein
MRINVFKFRKKPSIFNEIGLFGGRNNFLDVINCGTLLSIIGVGSLLICSQNMSVAKKHLRSRGGGDGGLR